MKLAAEEAADAASGICFFTRRARLRRCFRKFLNTAKFYDADYLILGGDITGKTMVPVERRARGWSASWDEHDYRDLDEKELAELEQMIRDPASTRSPGSTTSCWQLGTRSTASVSRRGRREHRPLDGDRRRTARSGRACAAT